MDIVLEPIPVRDAYDSRKRENTPGVCAPDAVPDRKSTMDKEPAKMTPVAGKVEPTAGAKSEHIAASACGCCC